MKIGMPVLFGFDSLEQNFILAEKLGFDFVELNLNFSYCRREMCDNALIDRLIKQYNKSVTLHFFDEGDFGTYQEVAASYYVLLERYMKAMIEHSPVNVVVHLIEGPVATVSGVKNYVYEKEFDEYYKRLSAMLNKVKTLCENCGSVLALENSKTVGYMKKTYSLLADEGFSFTLDVGHNEMCGGLVKKFYDEKKFDVKELHIHDVKLTENGTLTDHVNLGDGQVDVQAAKRFAEKNNAYALLELKSVSDLTNSIKYFNNL